MDKEIYGYEKENCEMKASTTNLTAVIGVMGALALLALSLVGCAELQTDAVMLSPSELAQEVREALAEPSHIDRNARLASALRQLSPENVDEVLAVYTELLKDLGQPELEPFFDAWTAFDAPAAFAYAIDIPHEGPLQIAQKAVTYAWATRDILGARVAAEQGIEDRPRSAALFQQGLIEGWAISGQDGLQDFILKGPAAEDPGQLILAAQPKIYLREGLPGLLEWSEYIIQNASSYAARMKAFRYAVRTAGFRDPVATIPFVLRHYGEEYAEEGPRVLVEKWMHSDTEAALEWLRTEAPEDSRAEALGMAAASWLHRDRIAAREWINSLPIGDPYYQPAFDKIAVRVARRDPPEGVEWCNRGQTPEINSMCLRQVAISWYKDDPVAAGQWLETESGLSVEDMNAVRDRAARSRQARKKGAQ